MSPSETTEARIAANEESLRRAKIWGTITFVPLLFASGVILSLASVAKGSPGPHFVGAAATIILAIFLSRKFWSCPSCKRCLGKVSKPKFCPHCSEQLAKDGRRMRLEDLEALSQDMVFQHHAKAKRLHRFGCYLAFIVFASVPLFAFGFIKGVVLCAIWIVGVPAMIALQLQWECPACKVHFRKAFNPKYCPSCSIQLLREES